ncbi:hypothetical protein SAMN04487948_11757 [Halogranum amylolyticum]|uniref:Uncharacterized protein n=2 Tax=Halogranum amylolyticum TaxID=660520 RepID=A0A1H8VK35_9EURY|nr:hypothetical protein SAMN04487948_11757 [Halogranum amylolyticum]
MPRYDSYCTHFPGSYPITVLETTATGTLYVEYAVTPTDTGSVAIGLDRPLEIKFDGLGLTEDAIDGYIKHAAGIWQAMTGRAPTTLEYDTTMYDSAADDPAASMDA